MNLEKRYTINVDKFRDFYKNNKDQLFGYLLRRTGDYHLAADILQESFTRYLERYKTRELSVALLFTIGRNLLYDNSRRRRTTVPYDERQQENAVKDEESVCLVREESRRMLAALQQLAPEEADILSLVVSSSMSYKEIAELTGTNETNIKVKIHRSRLKLKKILRTGEP